MVADQTRPYRSPLREAQAETTRTLILDALAELVAEIGHADVAIKELAVRAGTSERTVYRHFPDRTALFEALIERIADEQAWSSTDEALHLDTVADLEAAIVDSFDRFEVEEVPTRAAASMSEAMGRSAGESLVRNQRHGTEIRRLVPDLPDDEFTRLLGILRVVMSSRTWLRLKDEFGVDGADSGPLVAWVVRLVLDDVARTGRVPGRSPAAEG